jgi:hypothetical protein
VAAIGTALTEEAILKRVNLSDPQERFRLDTLVHDAARALSPEAVRVAIEAHRRRSRFMPELSDLMECSAEWRRDRADDSRRRALANEAAQRRALPAPSMPPEQWDAHVRQLRAALDSAIGPDGKPAGGAYAPAVREFPKPPAVSDASPALKALALARGLNVAA